MAHEGGHAASIRSVTLREAHGVGKADLHLAHVQAAAHANHLRVAVAAAQMTQMTHEAASATSENCTAQRCCGGRGKHSERTSSSLSE